MIQDGLQSEVFKIRYAAVNSVFFLSQACFPYGAEQFELIIPTLWDMLSKSQPKLFGVCIKAFTRLFNFMTSQTCAYYTRECIPLISMHFKTTDPELQIAILDCLLACFQKNATLKLNYKELFVNFLESFWNSGIFIDRKYQNLIVDIFCAFTKFIGLKEAVVRLLRLCKEPDEKSRFTAVLIVERLFNTFGTSSIDDENLNRVVDAVCFAVKESSDEKYNIASLSASIFLSFKSRINPFISSIMEFSIWNLSSRSPKIRMLASEFLAFSLSPLLKRRKKRCKNRQRSL